MTEHLLFDTQNEAWSFYFLAEPGSGVTIYPPERVASVWKVEFHLSNYNIRERA